MIVNVEGVGQVNFPDTMSPEEVSKVIERDMLPKRPKPANPTEGNSFGQNAAAAGGKAVYDAFRGVGALATDAFPSLAKLGVATRKDVDEANARDKPLMDTAGGFTGNLAGNVAMLAPTARIPGANTVVGGGLIGALTGAAQPVGEKESRWANAGIGTIAGGSIPALVKMLRMGKSALVDPFTDAGKERIVGSTLNRSAADPQAAMANLRNAQGSTPGFSPTVGQAADDAGLAAVERGGRAIDPAGFDAVDKSQRAALVNALRNIAKTPEERAAAEAAREAAAGGFYNKAKGAVVEGDETFNALMQRPSMKAAAEEAAQLAAERGKAFRMDGPISGESLHDLKMGLDTAIQNPTRGIVGAKRDATLGTKGEYLNWLESKIPEYGQGRQAYAEMSKPINQMDIGKEMYNRFVPALADGAIPFKSKADALAQALRNGDSLAQNVTGMKGAKLAGIMEPEQLAALQGVVKDSQLKAAAEMAGKGGGSDTVQKMAMSNVIAEAGLPSWMASVGRVPGGMLKTAGDMLYTKNDEAMRHLLADVLKDPQRAAKAMQQAGIPPSKIAEILRLTAQGGAMSAPAVANAQQ